MGNDRRRLRKYWLINLYIEKYLLEREFKNVHVNLDVENKQLKGVAYFNVDSFEYKVKIKYSFFHVSHYDRIYILDKRIKYHREIHVYRDMSLCLYHPKVDNPLNQIIPLRDMIPWVGEWLIYYRQWKKFGVWLGKEIKH